MYYGDVCTYEYVHAVNTQMIFFMHLKSELMSMYGKMIVPQPCLRWQDGAVERIEDTVVLEQLLTLHLNGREFLRIVASNFQLEEFGAGFFVAAGVTQRVHSVRVDGTAIFVEAEVCAKAADATGFTPAILEEGTVCPGGSMTPDEVLLLREALNADPWERTGGLHCAALWYDHQVVMTASDIGRHNAVDKVIGYMILHGLVPESCAFSCTGRQPAGMVTKAVNAGIPILVSRAAVTSKGIALAKASGVTLIGFARDRERRFTVYAHPERIFGLAVSGDPVCDVPEQFASLTDAACGWKYAEGKTTAVGERVVLEQQVTLYLNGSVFLKTVASNDMLRELGAGFFTAAGIARSIRSVRAEGMHVYVESDDVRHVDGEMESAGGFSPCCVSGSAAPGSLCLSPEEIFVIREAINVDAWNITGGLHCAVLYHNHRIVATASDIGRQNCVDKVIGYMILHHLPPGECVIGSTGRQPAGMVVKAANAGVPIIVSRAATTSAGVATADAAGVTLVCFVRPPRFTVYTHPERIAGL